MAIDLQRFCSTEADSREHLRAPWKLGKWVYAANGSIAIRVPAVSRPDITDTPKAAPNAAALFEKAFEADGDFLILPPVPAIQKCMECEGTGKVRAIRCPDCDGGSFMHGHYSYECKNCEDSAGGAGWERLYDDTHAKQPHEVQRPCMECSGNGYPTGGSETITLGEAIYEPAYLALFAGLPQVRVRPGDPCTVEKAGPAAFIFDGGQGLLMPRRY